MDGVRLLIGTAGRSAANTFDMTCSNNRAAEVAGFLAAPAFLSVLFRVRATDQTALGLAVINPNGLRESPSNPFK